MNAQLKAFWESSHLYGGNVAYLEELYESYLNNPDSVAPSWRKLFDRWQEQGMGDISHAPVRAAYTNLDRRGFGVSGSGSEMEALAAQKQSSVLRLINSYRVRGHQNADLDPLALRPQIPIPDLDPAFHGLGAQDMETIFDAGSLAINEERLPLKQILAIVRQCYTGKIGAEYMHITSTQEKRWIQNRLENPANHHRYSAEQRIELLERVTAGEGLEKYLHTKYVGQKRFSLEGGESLIPMLDILVQHGGQDGLREIVIGMAHRGRLNVLVNILGKNPADLFAEFEGKKEHTGSGDVKYHQGYSSDIATEGGPVHLVLGFNPSHLEIINPVIEGSVRARQHRRGDHQGDQVLPVLIHGDAAFAGQGVVMETLNMSKTRGYTTGGTIHIVVNNQIGFTTSYPLDTRSSLYCTDVAKMVEAPIFHVNGDDPEAVSYVTQLALDYRNTFHKEVVIDMVCYRRHGHNEADEPSATQPEMYQKIKARPTTRKLYAERLVADGVLSEAEADALVSRYRDRLDAGEHVARNLETNAEISDYIVDWAPYFNNDWRDSYANEVDVAELKSLMEQITEIPAGVQPHTRVARILADRRKMAAGALSLDWGAAETLAYATLLEEGHPVRISGQDAGRGTFFHRHAVVHSQNDGHNYIPLQHLRGGQADFLVIDSVLSEEAVLGFEYGYATADPTGLTVWEAQFGDFANGAQVVIDQFISSGEQKWGRLCGLALYLPHGFEGQGPEHSSARLERYLQLCAEFNMQVCIPSTPAQMYHMIRRQVLRTYRKPLIVMTPKSLLRHKLAVSTLEELANGRFQPVIDEIDQLNANKVRRVVLCGGKVYYDLLEARRAEGIEHVAIVRIEQAYPFPREELAEVMARYPKAKELVWCQEEPRNQGAWYPQRHHFQACLTKGQRLYYAGREASASPAVGLFSVHVEQQKALVEQALRGDYQASQSESE